MNDLKINVTAMAYLKTFYWVFFSLMAYRVFFMGNIFRIISFFGGRSYVPLLKLVRKGKWKRKDEVEERKKEEDIASF